VWVNAADSRSHICQGSILHNFVSAKNVFG
jgi:hypothetical protein